MTLQFTLNLQLLVAGALVAAGVAIVFGVRHFRGSEEPQHEDSSHWAKRKVSTTITYRGALIRKR